MCFKLGNFSLGIRVKFIFIVAPVLDLLVGGLYASGYSAHVAVSGARDQSVGVCEHEGGDHEVSGWGVRVE